MDELAAVVILAVFWLAMMRITRVEKLEQQDREGRWTR